MNWDVLGPHVPRRGNAFTIGLGRTVFRAMGWQVSGVFPNRNKIIVAVAPHSSNLDFIVAMAAVLGLGLRISFLGKHTLFNPLLGPLMYGLGGIPVDRSAPHGLVGEMVDAFNSRTQLLLGIAPEGTRSRVDQWKAGFALIAQATAVPVLPVALDYKTKTIWIGPLIDEVADVDGVVAQVKAFVSRATPKKPRV